MSIGKRIKELRLNKEMKQSDLAKISGVSRVAIGNYERGDRIPKADILTSIAMALDVSINELIGASEVKKLEDYTSEELLAELLRRARIAYFE